MQENVDNLPWASTIRRSQPTGLEDRMALLRCSIVYIDHYQTKEKLPVIRIFGRTKAEQPACVHVHGCHPYLFVKALEPTQSFVQRLEQMIQDSKFNNIVHRITLCKGLDFYGFRDTVEAFVRIEINAPSQLSSFGQFLQSGNHSLAHSFQPYETHIPYILQFMSDYELSGMGFLEIDSYRVLEPEERQTLDLDLGPQERRIEVATSVENIIVSTRADDDMRVPSLKGWLEELKEYVFTQDEDAYSHSPSLNTQRDTVRSHSNATLEAQFADWLCKSSDAKFEMSQAISPHKEDHAEEQVSSQEALQILQGFEGDKQTAPSSEDTAGDFVDGVSSSEDEAEDDPEVALEAETFSQSELEDWHNSSSSSANSSAAILGVKTGSVSNVSNAVDQKYLASKKRRIEKMANPRFSLPSPRMSSSFVSSSSPSSSSLLTSRSDSLSGIKFLRPLEDPPTQEELFTSERWKNFKTHQRPFFSLEDDAQKELAQNRRAPKAWLHTKKKRKEASVYPSFSVGDRVGLHGRRSSRLLSPKELPPSRHHVVRDLGAEDKTKSATKRGKRRGNTGNPRGQATEKEGEEEEVHEKNEDDNDKKDTVEQEDKTGEEGGSATMHVPIAIEKVDTGTRKLVDKKKFPSLAAFQIMIVEIIAKSSHKKEPNPDHDEVLCIYAAVYDDSQLVDSRQFFEVSPKHEKRLLESFAEYVQLKNPDAIAGWEIQRKSLGYILHRASKLGLSHFAPMLSRVPNGPQDPRHMNDSYGKNSYSEYWLAGRHVFNIWRIVRGEIDLSSYSMENVSQELFNEPIPKFSGYKLYDLFMRRSFRAIAMDHVVRVVDTIHRIVVHLDFITKSSEYSKLLGLDLFSTMTRGSQFRVEGVMVRVAKPLGYVLPSPSRQQVATQPGLEYIALNLEPKSNMYCDPVAVLDFRSLYPSVVIAYNLCFSTFVGKVKRDGSGEMHFEAGVFARNPCDRGGYPTRSQLLQLLREESLFITPSGSVYVTDNVRRGVLPLMLHEILNTRIAMKDGLKICERQGRDAWRRVLDARQLALKLLANVTYGYTAASFSGRMPMSALADSIVSVGKHSLETVMKLSTSAETPWFNSCPKPPRVVYGDTDSLFVHFPDCSLSGAFEIAKNIAQHASMLFPNPVKLQMEKVYLPSMLVAKKRYCGMKYESPGQLPRLESKGLETIRRDSCPIMKRVMNDMVMSLFTDRDLSNTKRIFQKHMLDILEYRVSVKDFVFASKVKVPIEERYRGPTLPPSAAVAKRLAAKDPMLMPVYKERVAYVIVNGAPAARLVDLVEPPKPDSNINVLYYIRNKIIRPLNRLFRLINVNVEHWYKSMNKAPTMAYRFPSLGSTGRKGIHRHFQTIICYACNGKFAGHASSAHDVLANDFGVPLCPECLSRPQTTAVAIAYKDKESERKLLVTMYQCKRCTGETGLGLHCQNLSCPAFYQHQW